MNNIKLLLEACKELREVAAAAMRIIDIKKESMDLFEKELKRMGIKNGWGVRIQKAIDQVYKDGSWD